MNNDLNMLAARAEGFAMHYFADMRFDSNIYEPSIIHAFLTVDHGGKECVDSSPELYLTKFNFTVGELGDGIIGECNTANMTITITPEYKNDDATILHEMIHAFEFLIAECTAYSQFHDVVLLCLYNDLQKKIPDLDERILHHAHIVTGVGITELGGRHDVLFLLKSYDLDLRLDLPLGTVCGYDRSNLGGTITVVAE